MLVFGLLLTFLFLAATLPWIFADLLSTDELRAMGIYFQD